jgi:DNA-binding GntR family transcriptional regulator
VLRTLTPKANNGHDDLLAAIASGDGLRAQKLMHEHVDSARNTIMSRFRHLRAQNSD